MYKPPLAYAPSIMGCTCCDFARAAAGATSQKQTSNGVLCTGDVRMRQVCFYLHDHPPGLSYSTASQSVAKVRQASCFTLLMTRTRPQHALYPRHAHCVPPACSTACPAPSAKPPHAQYPHSQPTCMRCTCPTRARCKHCTPNHMHVTSCMPIACHLHAHCMPTTSPKPAACLHAQHANPHQLRTLT